MSALRTNARKDNGHCRWRVNVHRLSSTGGADAIDEVATAAAARWNSPPDCFLITHEVLMTRPVMPRPHRGDERLRYLQWDAKEVPLNHLCGEDVHGLPASSFGVGSRFSSTRLPYAYLPSKYSFLWLLGFCRRCHVLSSGLGLLLAVQGPSFFRWYIDAI